MPLPTGLVVKNGSNARSLHFGRHAAAGVGDGEADIIAAADVADLVGGERHVGGGDAHRPGAVHRVARVDREVDDGVLELVRIDEDRPGVGVDGEFDGDPLAERPVEQVGHARDQFAAVDALGQQAARSGRTTASGGSARRRGWRPPSHW